MKRQRSRVEVGTLAVWGLGLLLGLGCDKSSEGTQTPAASAAPSDTAAAAPPSSAEQAAAAAPDNAGGSSGGDSYDDTDPSALTDFHQTLDSHGSWVEDPKVGTVWVPAPAAVGAAFVPYQTGGHWVYGDDYTWVSDYDWGWAPFHYGRWLPLETGGWGWIPGRVYSPAWVTWRVGAPGFGFVGWGPMAPTWGWRGGVVTTFGFAVAPRFSYCATGDLFNRGISGRVLAGPRIGQAEAGTKVWSEGASVGGHVSGPAPGKIGISNEAVAHPQVNDPAVAKAQAFGKPSTAVAAGGHPPSKSGGSNAKGGGSDKDKPPSDKDKPPSDKDKPPSDKDKPSSDKDKPSSALKTNPSVEPGDKPGEKPASNALKPTPAVEPGSKGGSKPPSAPPKKEK